MHGALDGGHALEYKGKGCQDCVFVARALSVETFKINYKRGF
jgi:hypothetical protein